jgi:hypothetical protein
MRRAVGLAVILATLACVVMLQAPTGAAQGRDPCGYRETADHITEVVIYKKAGGFEAYVLFANRDLRMISTFGTLRATINDAPLSVGGDFDCKDFEFFLRGSARVEVLGYIFKLIPLSAVQPVLHWGANEPPDRFCVRLTATYTAGKTMCRDFYGRL